jgi:hypothetical protein
VGIRSGLAASWWCDRPRDVKLVEQNLTVAREVGLFVPGNDMFPDTKGTPRELLQALSTLSRDDTLFQCARTNTIVTGFGDFEIVPRAL